MSHEQGEDRPTWSDVKMLVDDASLLAVRIQRLSIKRPVFSMQWGSMKDGRFLPYVRPRTNIEAGRVTLTPLDIAPLARLVLDAEAFVLDESQKAEDEFQARQRSRPPREDRGNNGRGNRRDGDERDRRWK